MLSSEDKFEVLLIGDTGKPILEGEDPVFRKLKEEMPSHDNCAVIFLGDLIYPQGLPPLRHKHRKTAEKVLEVHFDAVRDFPGRVVFISGNHDWRRGSRKGFAYVLREEKYIEERLRKNDVYLPHGGCPGPVEIPLSNHAVLIVINTQWWVQDGYVPSGSDCGCEVRDSDMFFEKLTNVLEKNRHKNILVTGHHPVFSDALHGGKFKLKHHLFPLTLYKKRGYVPLPVLGSAFTMYRKYSGAREDLSHPKYRQMRKQFRAVFEKFPNLIYAAGHEHNLQYIQRHDNHYIVSGSGSKRAYVRPGKHCRFGSSENGFFKLIFSSDGTVDMKVYEVNKKTGDSKTAFSGKIISSGKLNSTAELS